MLLFLSFFVSVRSNVMFHGLEQYFIRDSEENIVSFISISASPSESCITEKRERNQINKSYDDTISLLISLGKIGIQ